MPKKIQDQLITQIQYERVFKKIIEKIKKLEKADNLAFIEKVAGAEVTLLRQGNARKN